VRWAEGLKRFPRSGVRGVSGGERGSGGDGC
jgi:hypothetical protein